MSTYDFHIHSALSPCADNEMTPCNIVGMAKVMGHEIIAVSDHNSVKNAAAVMKAGVREGIRVIPAMEVETMEEVHILTLFKTLEAAEYAAKIVYDKLPDIKNRPEIFGEQCIMDEFDNLLGYEEKLLLSPAAISINELFEIVREANGIFIPAHIDRHSYSVLTNLGFIPDDIDIKYVEVSGNVDSLDDYINDRPFLKRYKITRSSDAHRLDSLVFAADDFGNIEELL